MAAGVAATPKQSCACAAAKHHPPHSDDPPPHPPTHLKLNVHPADRQLQAVDQHGHHVLHEGGQHAALAPRRGGSSVGVGAAGRGRGSQRGQLRGRQLGLLGQPGALAGGALL